MLRRVYLPIILRNKCFTPSEMKSRKIEILLKREWLLSIIRDLRNSSKLKKCWLNLLSHRMNLWCCKIRWQLIEEQWHRWKKDFQNRHPKMINLQFIKVKRHWSQKRKNRSKKVWRDKKTTCLDWRMRSERKKSK